MCGGELADLLEEHLTRSCSGPLHIHQHLTVSAFAESTKDPDMCFDYLLSGTCLESLMLTFEKVVASLLKKVLF